MKTARVAYGGGIHEARPHPAGLALEDGRILPEEAVVWLPPVEVGTVRDVVLHSRLVDRSSRPSCLQGPA